MPHLASLLRDTAGEVVADSDVIIASQACVEVTELLPHVRADHRIIDVNGWPALRGLPCHYQGVCW